MKKNWINPDFKSIDFTLTKDIKPGLKANCNPCNNIPWPSGMMDKSVMIVLQEDKEME